MFPSPCECLEVVVRLEHGVEMANQQESLTLTFLSGEKVARTIHFLGHIDPSRLQTQCIEFPGHDITDCTNTCMIHRAAADIDCLLQ